MLIECVVVVDWMCCGFVVDCPVLSLDLSSFPFWHCKGTNFSWNYQIFLQLFSTSPQFPLIFLPFPLLSPSFSTAACSRARTYLYPHSQPPPFFLPACPLLRAPVLANLTILQSYNWHFALSPPRRRASRGVVAVTDWKLIKDSYNNVLSKFIYYIFIYI